MKRERREKKCDDRYERGGKEKCDDDMKGGGREKKCDV